MSMDLERLNDHQNASLRSRPIFENGEDKKEIMRQIFDRVSLDLAEEYTKMDYRKHSSHYFLVDEPGGATWLVVHCRKRNKLTKRHSGTPRSLERALERETACWYKSKLDKRSGLWPIEVMKRAQHLSAFVAPNDQAFKWKVMPFGLANTPATFQDLMNQVLQCM